MRQIDRFLMVYLRYYHRRHMRFDDALEALQPPETPILLYIHIPFCEFLCPFCSFHRVKFDPERATKYFQALHQELTVYQQRGFRFSAVYVGGGTLTVALNPLCDLLQDLRQRHPIAEISVETNPNHLDTDKVTQLVQAGVTRLSVGVQSLDNELLDEMERRQAYGSRDDIMSALQRIQGQVNTFNVDMMFNFPRQGQASIEHDIELLKHIGVDQISYYPLMPALSTAHAMSKSVGLVSFERERQLYKAIVQQLSPDYRRSTAWCFSRGETAVVDEYIVDFDQYLGLGSGAFSYLNGAMYSSTFSINQYLRRVNQDMPGITAQRRLSKKENAQYTFLMKLFAMRLPKQYLQQHYGQDYRHLLQKEMLFFKLIGAVSEDDKAFFLTEHGAYYWVLMMREFFMGVNTLRDNMRKNIREESIKVEK